MQQIISEMGNLTPEDAEALLYEDAFCQMLREHAKGQDIHEFLAQQDASMSEPMTREELLMSLGL